MSEPTEADQDWQGPPPAVYEPQPAIAGVWPPAVGAGPPGVSAPLLVGPFQFVYKRLKGNLSDFREGTISVAEDGVLIAGKTMVRSEIYTPIVIVCVLISVLLAAIAHAVMRYGMLQPNQLLIPWSNISQIVLVPNKRWVGFSYTAPNYRGNVKQFCLCFALFPGQYEAFVEAAERYAPQVTTVGKLKPGSSIVLLVLVAVLIIGVIVGFALLGTHSR